MGSVREFQAVHDLVRQINEAPSVQRMNDAEIKRVLPASINAETLRKLRTLRALMDRSAGLTSIALLGLVGLLWANS